MTILSKNLCYKSFCLVYSERSECTFPLLAQYITSFRTQKWKSKIIINCVKFFIIILKYYRLMIFLSIRNQGFLSSVVKATGLALWLQKTVDDVRVVDISSASKRGWNLNLFSLKIRSWSASENWFTGKNWDWQQQEEERKWQPGVILTTIIIFTKNLSIFWQWQSLWPFWTISNIF